MLEHSSKLANAFPSAGKNQPTFQHPGLLDNDETEGGDAHLEECQRDFTKFPFKTGHLLEKPLFVKYIYKEINQNIKKAGSKIRRKLPLACSAGVFWARECTFSY